jgi:phosphatidate cytidylyltransferase
VGVVLLAVVGASLAFRPEPFVVFVVVAIGAAVLWELPAAFATAGIRLTTAPLFVGGSAMIVTAFTSTGQGLLFAYMATLLAIVVWRLCDSRSPDGIRRDVLASMFAATWLPLLAGFIILILVQHSQPGQLGGNWRVAMFILLAVASDTGGYIAGVLFGKHPMAPTVSPKKSWEGFAGSVILTALVGFFGARWVFAVPWVPGSASAHPVFGSALTLGLVLGVMLATTATMGDLAESLIKRDLGLKDMGSLLPGHGGVLDRVDSILVSAPFVYAVFSIATVYGVQ